MKINLGSGTKRIGDAINIDSDAQCKPDHVLTLGIDNLPFPDNSVDMVYAHHIFEHIGAGFYLLMQEIYRVCKPGAIIDIQVPHPRHDYFLGDLTHIRPITVENMRPFSKEYCDSSSYISNSWSGHANVMNVDFKLSEYKYIFDPTFKKLYLDSEKLSLDEVNWLARALNNTITEIHMKLEVVKNVYS